MAKSVLAGEMRTKITVKALVEGVNENGYPTKSWEDVFSGLVWCKWVNSHGTEVFETMRLDLKEAATVTMRYSPLVNERCRIWRENDPEPYEVISIDNVEDRRRFLEIKVKRVVTA